MSRVLAVAVAAILLGGCSEQTAGGVPEPAAGAPTTAAPGKTLVAALGDSITAGSPAYDPDPDQREQRGADDVTHQFGYWAEQAAPGFTIRNCGVWGERTDEIATRFEACAGGAKVLLVQGGINDVVQGRPVDEAAADLRAMAERGQAAGLEVLLTDVLPWTNGHPGADVPIAELNDRIEAIGRDLAVPVLPFHDTLDDPAEPGVFGPDLTTDGDHPNVAGHQKLGKLLAEALLATGRG